MNSEFILWIHLSLNTMPLIFTLAVILLLIFFISVLKLDTFISFVIVTVCFGLLTRMQIPAIGISIKKGIGDTMGELALIVGFGSMLGKLVAHSGAAELITGKIVKVFGEKYLTWGLALAGFIIGIPLFYNAGFIIVVPLIFSIASLTKLPIMYLAIPMLSALSVAHGYLPPHPSPAVIASQFGADLGKTLIYGIIISIPAIAIAGPVFGSTLKKFEVNLENSIFAAKDDKKNPNPPGLGISLGIALLPVFMISFFSIIKNQFAENQVIQLLSEPYISMLISVLAAIYFLEVRRGLTIKETSKLLEESIKSISPILLIIAGSGALKQVFIDSGTSQYLGSLLVQFDMNVLILSWMIAAIIRVCIGSATVAGLTTVGILIPMIEANPSVSKELLVLAVGSGSLMFSHINDGGFWLFKEYFNLSIKQTIRTWSVMETIVSIVGLIGVIILDKII